MKKQILYLLVLPFLMISGSLQAQPAGWSHIQPYLVTENSGTHLYGYQVRLEINTAALVTAGQMDALGADIRFGKDCQGLHLYDYWIDSAMNTNHTSIWVKTDTIDSAASKYIFMYYGNPAATAASTLAAFNGPNSATDSVMITGSGGVINSQRGFRFAPNEDILITGFGKYEPMGSNRFVTLFDFSTQAKVKQQTVSGPAATYSYGAFAQPFWLQGGVQYILALHQGATDGYYFGSSSQIGQHLTYYDMRYCNTCDENTFPTNSLGGMHYGIPDLHYYTRHHITPEPTVAPATDPVVEINGLDTTEMCVYHAPLTLSGTPSGGVFSGDGVTGNIFNPSVAGLGVHEVYYTYTYATNCVAYDTVEVNILACLGIEEGEYNADIRISPNPGSGLFNVYLKEAQTINLTLFDPLGKQLLQKNSEHAKKVSLDLTNLTAGVYFLQAEFKGQKKILRLVVQQ
ncbi:MAG TPA: DUF2341 domain-containing protein [Bacteroidales bacterium]|nr:DUF2341 domain-containing protein [Bacteroidales bacterium]